jgi:hypothetical protein
MPLAFRNSKQKGQHLQEENTSRDLEEPATVDFATQNSKEMLLDLAIFLHGPKFSLGAKVFQFRLNF